MRTYYNRVLYDAVRRITGKEGADSFDEYVIAKNSICMKNKIADVMCCFKDIFDTKAENEILQKMSEISTEDSRHVIIQLGWDTYNIPEVVETTPPKTMFVIPISSALDAAHAGIVDNADGTQTFGIALIFKKDKDFNRNLSEMRRLVDSDKKYIKAFHDAASKTIKIFVSGKRLTKGEWRDYLYTAMLKTGSSIINSYTMGFEAEENFDIGVTFAEFTKSAPADIEFGISSLLPMVSVNLNVDVGHVPPCFFGDKMPTDDDIENAKNIIGGYFDIARHVLNPCEVCLMHYVDDEIKRIKKSGRENDTSFDVTVDIIKFYESFMNSDRNIFFTVVMRKLCNMLPEEYTDPDFRTVTWPYPISNGCMNSAYEIIEKYGIAKEDGAINISSIISLVGNLVKDIDSFKGDCEKSVLEFLYDHAKRVFPNDVHKEFVDECIAFSEKHEFVDIPATNPHKVHLDRMNSAIMYILSLHRLDGLEKPKSIITMGEIFDGVKHFEEDMEDIVALIYDKKE